MSEHGGGSVRRDGGEDNINENGYVHRLMRIRCTHGSIDNYINLPKDHGVLAGQDQEPLLNANDHIAGEHIIHFGKCDSDENPERVFRKGLVGGLLGGPLLGGLVSDVLEKTGIMSFDCKPKTDEVWEETNDRNILEGAPAVLMKSCLTCRYGGIITLVPLDEYPQEDQAQQDENQEGETPQEEKPDPVREETDAVLQAAMDRIASTGEPGQQAVQEAQMYMAATAAATAADAAAQVCSAVTDSLPGTQGPSWMQAISCPLALMAENYAHNLAIPFAGPFLDSAGMIVSQGLMQEFRVGNFTVAQAGGGAVAVYNACKLLKGEETPPFADVVHDLESCGFLSNPYGMMPCGIADYLIREGCQVQMEATDIGEKMRAAGTGMLMYAAADAVRYVTCNAVDGDNFAFYNLPEGMGDAVQTMTEFESRVMAGGVLPLLGMTIAPKETEQEKR